MKMVVGYLSLEVDEGSLQTWGIPITLKKQIKMFFQNILNLKARKQKEITKP